MSSKYSNPPPSYSWEPLDLEEVRALTSIELTHKDWKVYFTNFHEIAEEIHEDLCIAKRTRCKRDCNCRATIRPAMIAIWKAGTPSSSYRAIELVANVPVEAISNKEILTNPTLRPAWVLESLRMGFETLITLLKVFEVTGLVLDFGPPMMLYKGDSTGRRQDVRKIDGDILWNILHDMEVSCSKQPQLDLKESSQHLEIAPQENLKQLT